MSAFEIVAAASNRSNQIHTTCEHFFRHVCQVVELPVSPYRSKYIVVFTHLSERLQIFMNKLFCGTCQGITYAARRSWYTRLAPFAFAVSAMSPAVGRVDRDLSIQIEFTMLRLFAGDPTYVALQHPESVPRSAYSTVPIPLTDREIATVLNTNPNIRLLTK